MFSAIYQGVEAKKIAFCHFSFTVCFLKLNLDFAHEILDSFRK